MNDKRLGRQTVALAHPPSVLSFSNIGGKFEGQGPLADFFDEISNDSFFGEKTWEKAESAMQKTVLQRALEKAELTPEDLDYILAGDPPDNRYDFFLFYSFQYHLAHRSLLHTCYNFSRNVAAL